jgi:single-strand DNA-binding protein
MTYESGSQDVNEVRISGRCGSDFEMRTLSGGNVVGNVSIALTRVYRSSEGLKESTDWFRCVAWGDLARKCADAVLKGSRVEVSGALRQNNWTDAEGNKRYSTEIVCSDVKVVAAPRRSASATEDGADQVSATV